MMNVRLTRKQVLDLMKELPEKHWLQDRLLNALNTEYEKVEKNNGEKNRNEVATKKAFTPQFKSETTFDPKPIEAKDVKIHSLASHDQYKDKDYVKDLNVTCNFKMDWMGTCKKPVLEGTEQCLAHYKVKCSFCGNTAFETCDFTGQFVCGAPVCDEHSRHNHRH